jgi:hypothetical protein
MRKLLCFLTTAVVLMGASGVRADVRPPIQVRILGEPRAAEPGVPFEGQLQIDSDISAVLGNFRFGGSSWNQLTLAVASEVSVDKGQPLVLDFSVVASDPEQWLDLTYEVDGRTVTSHFNLSSKHIASLLAPGTTTSVTPTGSVPPLTEETRISPLPAASETTAEPERGGPDGSRRSIRVHGRFTYQRSDGTTIGGDGLTVRVYDNNAPFPSSELTYLATDAQGWYDVTFNWSGGIFDAEPDLYLRFETANSRIQVEDPGFWATVYAWETDTTWNYSGSDLDYGWLQPGDINQHTAVHVLTNLVRTWRWWTSYGYDTPFVRANWPNGDGGAYYNGEIYFGTSTHWRESTASHEYGHHWVENFALSPAPDYCNGICDPPGDCGHCWWCEENANVSFTEGFPDWMGDVIPGSFGSNYGNDALWVYDFENLAMCGSTFVNPLITEGFLAAVVRDIGDNTNDDDPNFARTDELSLGWGPAITCVDLDAPTTAADFLTAFKNRNPWAGEGLWATAKNCGYETDVAPPPAVTNLYSTSHATSGDSPDPTIDLVWTRAVDDASGVWGYGITIANSIGLPSAVMDLGDETSYTTSVLPPGTYYFSIRTLDRAGRWSETYAWNGPYTVRAPLAANLAVYLFGGWDQVLVPRPAADASFSSVPAPLTLPGNNTGTYWNVGLWNNGESYTNSGFEIRCHVDSDFHWWVWSGELGPYWGQYGVNLGPLWIRGGRHTFETRLDATDLIAETNESDNRWAHQWIWTPLPLAANTPVVRYAPPIKTAGWDAVVDGSPIYYNCDGLRMGASSYWDVTVLRPLDAAADHDLYLHGASTGASDGFAGTLTGSARGAGVIDAVIVNRNLMGWGSQDVGVINYNGHGANYEAVHATNLSLAFGDSVTVPFSQDQMLRVWEFYLAPSNVGPVSITVDVDPAGGPLVAQWLDKNFTTGGLYTYSAASMTDASGRARLDVTMSDVGYHALLVYRDPNFSTGNGPLNVTIELDRTPPDFVPLYAAGWYAPIVPRAAFDGTGDSVPAPTTLPGNVASTYLNMAARNESPSDSPAGLPGHISVDGSYAAWVAWGSFPAYGNGLFNWGYPWTFSGGRHTLAWKLDAGQTIEEIHEDNNVYSEQWVWSPLDLINNVPVVRGMPADPYGGWTELSGGEPFYPNCDGVRMPAAGGYWRAVAVMPSAGSDVDVRLHAASTGAKNGFADNLTGSYWGGSTSDYVLVNFNLAPGYYEPLDAGVVRYSGWDAYTTESTVADGYIPYPNGTYGPYSLAANRIVNVYEFYLTPGQLEVRLANLSGSVDWGLTLHRADLAYLGKSDALAMSYAGGGAGGNEEVVIDVPASGYYCVAVWKCTATDLPLAGSYNLVIGPPGTVGVDDPVPAPQVTALVDITPNPFNPQTTITFDLAREGRAQLEIYDLQGRLVRTLVNGTLGSGRHAETWNGSDDTGNRAASGLYIARLSSGGVTQMKKMTLLK